MRRILLCERAADGSTQITTAATALFIGVSVDHLLEQWAPADGADALPTEFKRRGIKRSKHARNATGYDDATVNLAYLAARDWKARIDFDEAAGKMWAVID